MSILTWLQEHDEGRRWCEDPDGDADAYTPGESADNVPDIWVSESPYGGYTVKREVGWYEQHGDADSPEGILSLLDAMDLADEALCDELAGRTPEADRIRTLGAAVDRLKAENSDLRAQLVEAQGKAIRFDLDQLGIEQRDKEAVELVDLRAEVARLRAPGMSTIIAMMRRFLGQCDDDSYGWGRAQLLADWREALTRFDGRR